jgi:hypothetical protein
MTLLDVERNPRLEVSVSKKLKEIHMRGYDDQALLEKMAAGIMSRDYSSVDEAARQVLGEDTGANVDRLRRKFRSEAWFEKGLQMHVEEEIRKRGLVSASELAPRQNSLQMIWSFVKRWVFWFWLTILPFIDFVDPAHTGRPHKIPFSDFVGRKCILLAPCLLFTCLWIVATTTFAQGWAGFGMTIPLVFTGLGVQFVGEKLTTLRLYRFRKPDFSIIR